LPGDKGCIWANEEGDQVGDIDWHT
jgi:hypothetical protein